jgi:hypothetical protein
MLIKLLCLTIMGLLLLVSLFGSLIAKLAATEHRALVTGRLPSLVITGSSAMEKEGSLSFIIKFGEEAR